jgi:8-oxo-dGTP pyrophosphatase MutT (NUDIX family)
MHRKPFLDLLNSYQTSLEDEKMMHQHTIDFVSSTPDCFLREHPHGHITASVWIVNPSYTKILMTLHSKIGIWLQPGGHCDGDTDVYASAVRELEEETGLSDYMVLNSIFDIDVHEIAPYKNEPAHLHFDTRFLAIADDSQDIIISEESKDLKWFSLDEALANNHRRSISRMIDKTRLLSNK